MHWNSLSVCLSFSVSVFVCVVICDVAAVFSSSIASVLLVEKYYSRSQWRSWEGPPQRTTTRPRGSTAKFFTPPPSKAFDVGGILFSGVSVREWSLCTSRKLCEHHAGMSKTNEGTFTQFWPQMYLGFVDVLIRFWGQKVKDEAHSSRRHNRRR